LRRKADAAALTALPVQRYRPVRRGRTASGTGSDAVVAEVLPGGKVEVIRRLRADHGPLAFVGDGINDAPALAEADVGRAVGTGTDIAIEAADVVLVSGRLTGVPDAIAPGRATMGKVRSEVGRILRHGAPYSRPATARNGRRQKSLY
jgi:hypothetical protein